MTATVIGYLILISINFSDCYFPVFSLVLISNDKINQTRQIALHHISKHLEVRQKYSAARCIFNSFFGVWR